MATTKMELAENWWYLYMLTYQLKLLPASRGIACL